VPPGHSQASLDITFNVLSQQAAPLSEYWNVDTYLPNYMVSHPIKVTNLSLMQFMQLHGHPLLNGPQKQLLYFRLHVRHKCK